MASFGSPTAALRIACVGNSITRGDARQEPGEGTHTPHKYKTFNRGNFPAELATLRSMPRLLVRGSTAPPVTPGDGDSAY